MMKINKNIVFLSALLFSVSVFAQTTTVKLMNWNVLNFPGSNDAADSALRCPFYRTVVQYVRPDILVTEENASSIAPVWLLNNVLNSDSNNYSSGDFIDGYDSDNSIYYRTSLFHFVSNVPIQTDVRDINQFTLVHIPSGDTLRIYAVHLKASSGTANEASRAVEVDSLRKVTNALPAGTDFIVCGDFNIYGSTESCYQKLLQDNITDDGNFIDPISMTGVWNNANYAPYHTQSPRTRSFGGGANGGMDDRFDLILFSNAINNPGRITYVPGSTTPIGNDGQHYNDSINHQPNTAVPVNVANALHYASDHLPVTILLEFENTSSISEISSDLTNFSVFPNPFKDYLKVKYSLTSPSNVHIILCNILGEKVAELVNENKSAGTYDEIYSLKNKLPQGVYFVKLQTNKSQAVNKLIFMK